MSKHRRLAVLVAPFLIVGGYVAADYYLLAKDKAKQQQQAYQFELQNPCGLQTAPCVLRKGELELELSVESSREKLMLKTNQMLDGVTLALNSNKPESLKKGSDGRWQMRIESNSRDINKLRLVTSINKQFYFAEIDLAP